MTFFAQINLGALVEKGWPHLGDKRNGGVAGFIIRNSHKETFKVDTADEPVAIKGGGD